MDNFLHWSTYEKGVLKLFVVLSAQAGGGVETVLSAAWLSDRRGLGAPIIRPVLEHSGTG